MNVQPEVRAIDGYPVVLPCTFSHPQHSQHSSLQVLWRLGHSQGATVLYHCTSRPGAPTCEPGPQQDQRYRLEGNPREHDLSLRINSATLQDSGRYYCRVEVQGREHVSFEDKMGTRLRVEGMPEQTTVSGNYAYTEIQKSRRSRDWFQFDWTQMLNCFKAAINLKHVFLKHQTEFSSEHRQQSDAVE